jgi:hypothetical protein
VFTEGSRNSIKINKLIDNANHSFKYKTDFTIILCRNIQILNCVAYLEYAGLKIIFETYVL